MGPEKFCGNGGVSDPPRHSYNSTCGKNENFNSPESIVPVVRFLVSGEQARFKSSFGRFEKIPSVANVGSYQFSTVLGETTDRAFLCCDLEGGGKVQSGTRIEQAIRNKSLQ